MSEYVCPLDCTSKISTPRRLRLLVASVIVGVTLSLIPLSARADGDPAPEPQTQTQTPRHFGAQRTFGLGPIVGWGNGAGGTIGVSMDPVGLWVSGGYMPIFVVGNEHDLERTPTFNAYSSAMLSADLTFLPWHAGKRTDFGLLAGYKYNSLLGHGIGGGAAITIDLSRVVGLLFSIDLIVFPDADNQLAATGYPSDRDATIPWLQGGGNVGLIFYP